MIGCVISPILTKVLPIARPDWPDGAHNSSPHGNCTNKDITAAFWLYNGSWAIWPGFGLNWKIWHMKHWTRNMTQNRAWAIYLLVLAYWKSGSWCRISEKIDICNSILFICNTLQWAGLLEILRILMPCYISRWTINLRSTSKFHAMCKKNYVIVIANFVCYLRYRTMDFM